MILIRIQTKCCVGIRGKGKLPSLLVVWFWFVFLFVFVTVFATGWYLTGVFLTTILLGRFYYDFRVWEHEYQSRAAVTPQR